MEIKNNRNQKLVGILHKPDENKFPVAIFCHGYRSSKESRKAIYLAEHFPKNGIGLFRFDFSGCGESEGKFEDSTITKYSEDLDAVIDYIKEQEFTDKIIIIGSSLGGMISILNLSKRNDVDYIIFIAPAVGFTEHHRKTDEFSSEGIKEWKKRGWIYTKKSDGEKLKIKYSIYEDQNKYNFLELAKKINIPCLIIHGDEDDICLLSGSEILHKNIKDSKLEILEGQDHMMTMDGIRELTEISLIWLKSH